MYRSPSAVGAGFIPARNCYKKAMTIVVFNLKLSLIEIFLIHTLFVNLHKIRFMTNKDYIKNFTPNLFWDTDFDTLDMDKYPAYIIPRVMEYGELKDWKLINQYYGLDKIVEVCKKVRSLRPECVSFLCLVSGTNIEDYRCYHFRQSYPTHWNS